MEDGADAEGKRFPGARAAEVTLETQATEIIGSRGIRGGLRRVLVHRLARVAYAGATSALVDFSIFNVLLIVLEPERTTHILLANSAAFIGAMVVNYTINSRITFGVRPTRRSLIAYVVFTSLGLVLYNVNLVWIRGLFDAVSPLALNISKVGAMALLVVWNYVGYERFVFGPETRRLARQSALQPALGTASREMSGDA